MTEDFAALSKVRRAQLAADWPIETPELAARRRAGTALGVYDDTSCLWRSPKFQFLGDELIQEMFEILKLLSMANGRKPGGWSEVEWFLSPHVLLDGCPPYEVMACNPKTVLNAARVEFLEEDDAGGF